MSFKEWREQNPGLVNAVAAALAVIALLVVAYNFGFLTKERNVADQPLPKLYYYDLNKNELFTAEDELSPIPAPSGPMDGKPAGVLASVYACGDCANASARKVAYLEKIDEEFLSKVDPSLRKGYYNGTSPATIQGIADATLVKTPDSKTWVARNSDEGRAITEANESNCPESAPYQGCLP